MGVKFSELPILDPSELSSEDYYAVLDHSSGVLKRTNIDIPLPIDKGGTGNIEGYIRSGRQPNTIVGVQSTAEGSNTTSSGLASHAEGVDCKAINDDAHAEGHNTEASGQNSHAEGDTTVASNHNAHAEGYKTTASGECAHAEGRQTVATKWCAHSEGYQSKAQGQYSHAEGYATTASNSYAHAEGGDTTASGEYSHAEGNFSTASNTCAHAEGCGTSANGNYSHTSGYHTTAGYGYQTVVGKFNNNKSDTYFEVGNGNGASSRSNAFEVYSDGSISQDNGSTKFRFTNNGTSDGYYDANNAFHTFDGGSGLPSDPLSIDHGGTGNADGFIRTGLRSGTTAGTKSTAEGLSNTITGDYSHAEGYNNIASGTTSHAEGYGTKARGNYSHAEGFGCTIGTADSLSTDCESAHVEGDHTTALMHAAHAEGDTTHAEGRASHSEGYQTYATDTATHAEGYMTSAGGEWGGVGAHAEGNNTIAEGESAHAEGTNSVTTGYYSHVGGFGVENSGECSFVHGAGTPGSSTTQFKVDQSYVAVFGNGKARKFSDTSYRSLICPGPAFGVSFKNEICESGERYDAGYGCCGTLCNASVGNSIKLFNLIPGGIYMLYTTTYNGGPDSTTYPLGKVLVQHIHMISVGINNNTGLASEVFCSSAGTTAVGVVSVTLDSTMATIKLDVGSTVINVGINFSLMRIN